MPRTVTILDPRPRTRSIHLDLVSPQEYRIVIVREKVEQDANTGEIVSRQATRSMLATVTFNANGVPTARPGILALLAPIQAEVEAMEAEAEAADAARAAAEAAAAAAAAAAAEALARELDSDLPVPGP